MAGSQRRHDNTSSSAPESMAQLKEDNRILKGLMLTGILATVGAFGLYRVFSVGAGVFAIFGVVVLCVLRVAWLVNFFKCPRCGRRLRSEPWSAETKGRIRHFCEACDTIWVSRVAVGTSGDL